MAAYEQFTQYDVELEVPEEAVQVLDDNVRKGMCQKSRTNIPAKPSQLELVLINAAAVLPPNSEFDSIIPHGPSFWGRTARLNTVLDGAPVAYFLKVTLD